MTFSNIIRTSHMFFFSKFKCLHFKSKRFLLKKYWSQKLFACFNLKGEEMDFGKIASVVLIFMGKLSDVTQNMYAVC